MSTAKSGFNSRQRALLRRPAPKPTNSGIPMRRSSQCADRASAGRPSSLIQPFVNRCRCFGCFLWMDSRLWIILRELRCGTGLVGLTCRWSSIHCGYEFDRFDEAMAAWTRWMRHGAGERAEVDGSVGLRAAAVASKRQTWRRMLPARAHEQINELSHASAEELGGSPRRVLADRLQIRRARPARRFEEAADLGPRRTLTGEPLPPKLEATAAGQAAGLIRRRARQNHPRLLRPTAALCGRAHQGGCRRQAGRHRDGVSP